MEGQPKFTHGANQLTNTLTHMMKGIAEQPPQVDFGIINSDYSITLNSFPKPVPKDEYSVCRHLLYDPEVPLTTTYSNDDREDGEHDHPDASPPGGHTHLVKLPPKMRWLQPGDKVLVAVVQNEFIVIDIVYDAKYLGENEPDWK